MRSEEYYKESLNERNPTLEPLMDYSPDYPDEVDPVPLGGLMLNYLVDLDNEENFLDFKESLSISRESPFPKIEEHVFAFANQAALQQKFNGNCTTPLTNRNRVFDRTVNGSLKRFAAIYVPPRLRLWFQ